MPGWFNGSWGYHGDDGKKFAGTASFGDDYSQTYGVGDTVGCGVDEGGSLFYTKNGEHLGKIAGT